MKASKREWYGLVVAWALALGVFSFWPQLDLIISQWARHPSSLSGDTTPFPYGQLGFVRGVWWAVPLIGQTIVVLGLLGFLLRRFVPTFFSCAWAHRMALSRYRTRMLALWLVVFWGLGLAVNWGLKEVWGRPRPAAVQELGGVHPFQKIYQISDYCSSNCSFVSGHAATGFALLGWGLMASPAVRRRWWRVGMGAGLFFGLGRIIQGGHFTSDIVFAGLVIWLTAAVIRSIWLRLRWRRFQRSRMQRLSSV